MDSDHGLKHGFAFLFVIVGLHATGRTFAGAFLSAVFFACVLFMVNIPPSSFYQNIRQIF